MKKPILLIAFLLTTICCAVAQNERKFDPQRFNQEMQQFITSEAGLTPQEAADFFGFNSDYFRRYFKRRAGISFSDFYKRLTMDYARLLLSSGHYKVAEVSDMLGYSSADYFTRVFKKVLGHVPSDFRK